MKEETRVPTIRSLAELEAQLALNHGWLILHVGITPHSPPIASARAFENARLVLEDRIPVTLLRCVLTSKEALCCPLMTSFDPEVHVFYRGEILESLRAPVSATAVIEMVELLYAYHTEDAPRAIFDPPSDGG